MSYEAFGFQVQSLEELEWKEVTEEDRAGRLWIVQEKGGEGYRFRTSISW